MVAGWPFVIVCKDELLDIVQCYKLIHFLLTIKNSISGKLNNHLISQLHSDFTDFSIYLQMLFGFQRSRFM